MSNVTLPDWVLEPFRITDSGLALPLAYDSFFSVPWIVTWPELDSMSMSIMPVPSVPGDPDEIEEDWEFDEEESGLTESEICPECGAYWNCEHLRAVHV